MNIAGWSTRPGPPCPFQVLGSEMGIEEQSSKLLRIKNCVCCHSIKSVSRKSFENLENRKSRSCLWQARLMSLKATVPFNLFWCCWVRAGNWTNLSDHKGLALRTQLILLIFFRTHHETRAAFFYVCLKQSCSRFWTVSGFNLPLICKNIGYRDVYT